VAEVKLSKKEEYIKMSIENIETRTPFSEFWRKFKKQKLAFVAFFFVILLIVIAIIGPSIVPYDITEPDYSNVLSGPSAEHWAGTDAFGRDIFSRVIAGTQISLIVGLSSVLLGAIGGTLLGLLAG